MDETRGQFKARFQAKVNEIMATKKGNSVYLTKERYEHIIASVRQAGLKEKQKTVEEYNFLRRFSVIQLPQGPRLVHCGQSDKETAPDDLIYYAHTDELFDILHEYHIQQGHGGRNKMKAVIKKK